MKSIIPLLLLLAMSSQAMKTGCPPEEDISPCMCIEDDFDVDVTLTCTDETMTPDDLLKVMRVFSPENEMAVELDRLVLGRLPSRFFENVNVKRLEFWHCELDGLTREGEDGKPLAGLEDTLEELIISSSFNDDTKSPKLEFGHLNKLQLLEISYNSIATLGDDWFKQGPASLTKLVISNNGVERLGKRAFAGLTSLESLYLDGNRFGPIHRSMLPNPANGLKKLELDNNALTGLPDDIFSSMPSLSEVSLRTNGLRRMPRETFLPVWEQLETVDMRGNSIECDSHLQWMFQVRTMARVFGRCFSPPEKEGVELKDLFKGKVQI